MEQKTEKKKQGTITYKKKEIKREIPKNVRQIGEPKGTFRIYIEDSVITYLNQLAHPTNSIARGALLLGNYVDYGEQKVLYISGAMEADNLSFDMKEVHFTDKDWSEIYDQVAEYFKEEKVVGWFLSRLGYSVDMTESMRTQHLSHFKEEHSVLYLLDALEQEDALYIREADHLKQMPGYYIYYERNTPMQNYLIEHQALERGIAGDKRIDYKDGQLLHSYHEMMASRRGQREDRKVAGLLYVTSALMVAVFLALSISIFNNYDKIDHIQQALARMTNEEGGEQTVAIATTELSVVTEEERATEHPAKTDSPVTTEAVSESLAATEAQPAAEAETTQQVEEASAMATDNYYIVQAGDTLATISEKMYHSTDYIDMIREANEIGASDYIYPGQQIIIPLIQ